MSKRQGYTFEAEVQAGLELAKPAMWFKIPDGKSMGIRTPLKVPADFIYTFDSMCSIEAKHTKLQRMPWRNFKVHQVEWVLNNPRSAYFIVGFTHKRSKRVFLLFADQLYTFLDQFDTSIPMAAFEETCIELTRLTGRHNPERPHAFVQLDLSLIHTILSHQKPQYNLPVQLYLACAK